MEEQIIRAAQRVAQLSARKLLRDMRIAAREKSRDRRADVKRRLLLGSAVVEAGCGEWPARELVGLLIDGRERYEHSPTLRLGLRKRGEAHMGYAAEDNAESFPIQGPPDRG